MLRQVYWVFDGGRKIIEIGASHSTNIFKMVWLHLKIIVIFFTLVNAY